MQAEVLVCLSKRLESIYCMVFPTIWQGRSSTPVAHNRSVHEINEVTKFTSGVQMTARLKYISTIDDVHRPLISARRYSWCSTGQLKSCTDQRTIIRKSSVSVAPAPWASPATPRLSRPACQASQSIRGSHCFFWQHGRKII